MDLIIRVDRMPAPGETVAGREFVTAHGGKGANQAVAAVRLGADVTFLGAVGGDAHGRALLEGLAAEGIDTSRIGVVREASGTALILVDRSGQNTIVVALGANGVPGPEYVTENAAALAASDVLLLQLEMRIETVDEAIRVGRAPDTLVVLDAAPAPDRFPDRLCEVDVLTPNETEAAALLGRGPIGDIDDARDAVAAMQALGPRIVALKLGDRGAVIGCGGVIEHTPAFPVQAVDTTACGDAWTAGFAIALAEGASPTGAARVANACGAAAATSLGAQPSLPTRERVDWILGD
jgi:ribokinase